MSKKQTLAILTVIVAVLGAAFYLYQAPAPAIQDEFSTIDAWFSEMDDYLDFKNQEFDYDLGKLAENWELPV